MHRPISHVILGLMFICLVSCEPQNEIGTPFQKGQEVIISASMPDATLGGGIRKYLINNVFMD